jgi:hypothetical protein
LATLGLRPLERAAVTTTNRSLERRTTCRPRSCPRRPTASSLTFGASYKQVAQGHSLFSKLSHSHLLIYVYLILT